MVMQDVEIIGMLKNYVKASLKGMGALKGAACQIASIEESGGDYLITFTWEDNDGETHTDSVTLKDGVEKVGELTDVNLSTLNDGDMLYYDSTAGKWVNVQAGAMSDATYNAIAAVFA